MVVYSHLPHFTRRNFRLGISLGGFFDHQRGNCGALGHFSQCDDGELINFVASLAILSVLFGMLFKWFPDADVDWQDVVPGAVATALLFNIGKFVIAWYIGTQGLESTYGAAASIVILLIWVYYSAQIVLFGAELTHAYAITRRSAKSGSQITSAER